MLATLLSILVASGPGPMAGHSLVYSMKHRSTLLLLGDASGIQPTYRLDGNKWKPIPGAQLPARSLAAAASDEKGDIFVHGGAIGSPSTGGGTDFKPTTETWILEDQKWRLVSNKGPDPRDHHAMAYDSNRRKFVLFGGSDADPAGRSNYFGDTWEWADGSWTKVSESGPGLRCHHAMVYDPVRKVTLLVGGSGPSPLDAVTWAWDGKSWSSASKGPPADRQSPRLAWDEANQRVVLFGGSVGDDLPHDTWSWDGKVWRRIAQDGPPGRTVHAIAYDPERKKVVLYGGATGNDVLGDIWEFDGERWKQVAN